MSAAVRDPGETSPSAGATTRRTVLVTAFGALVALACTVFVVQQARASWDEASDSLANADLRWVAVAVTLAVAGMVAIAVPWRGVLAALGEPVPGRATVATYFVGEIGKYLPGGIWPVVGRGELITRRGVPRRSAYASVLLSLATLYLAALFVAAALVPVAVASDDGPSAALWFVALLPVGLVALHPRVLRLLIGMAERLTRRQLDLPLPRWGTMLGLVATYLPAWLLIGSATWALAEAFGGGASWYMVCATTALSWAAGFLVAPVPGGVGVREAVFVAAIGGLGAGVAAVVAVAARLLFVLVDGTGALVGGAVMAADRKR